MELAEDRMERLAASAVGAIAPAADRIKRVIERIENLEEQRAGLADDIREIKKDAKNEGFDLKALNKVLQLRKLAADERQQLEELVDLYMTACGDKRQGMLI